MKKIRLITILVIALVIFSAWTPSPVFASAQAASAGIRANSSSQLENPASPILYKLTVKNKTGGKLFIVLKGKVNYYFVVGSRQVNATFYIESGRYEYTLTTSACGGFITRSRSFKGGGGLGTVICSKKK